MSIIQSNSIERLQDKIKDLCRNDETANSLYKNISDTCDKFGADIEKVSEELLKVLSRPMEIVSPYNYISKVTYNLIVEKGDTLKRDFKKPCFLYLHLALDENNFTGEPWEKIYIDLIEEQCFEFVIPLGLMCDLNKKIIDYCVKNNRKTYKDFAELFLQSKVLKRVNFPFDFMKEQAQEQVREMKELVDYVEEKKCLHLKTISN